MYPEFLQNWSVGSSWPPLREFDLGALDQLGLSPADFDCFCRTFVGERWCYAIRRGDDWRCRPAGCLTTSLLLQHLQGALWIGTGARWRAADGKFVTNHFVVDLDLRTTNAEPDALTEAMDDLQGRYEATLGALGEPTLAFRSSASGGLHLYYLLDQELDLHQLRTPDGARGALPRLLHASGLRECPGKLELYPRGAYRERGIQARLRLPFGAGSRLLDPQSLEPLRTPDNPVADLRLFRRLLEDGRIEPVDSTVLLRRSLQVPRPTRSARASAWRAPAGVDVVGHETYVRHLLYNGLTEPGERNRAVSALAFHWRWAGLAEERAAGKLRDWLVRAHNGKSSTYNRDPEAALADATAIVARVYARHAPRSWVPLPPLSSFEAWSILLPTLFDRGCTDPESGELLSRFKLQSFMFQLLRLTKQYVLTMGTRAMQETGPIDERDEEATGREAELLQRLAHLWPDPYRNRFVVAIPYVLTTRIRGIGEGQLGAYWRAAQATGVFRLVRESQWPRPVCKHFEVRLDFGTTGAADDGHVSLEGAIARLIPPHEVRRLYSRHHAEKVLSQAELATNRDGAAELLPFERIVRRHLG